jgi:ribosome-associated translation inhibitor RaiA
LSGTLNSIQTEIMVMEIQITDRNVSLTDVQAAYVQRRLQYALGRFGSRIRVARVTLTDLDGPNDGTDVLCRLKVTLKQEGNIIVGDTDVSVEAAVANVADRCARSIARLLDRQRDQSGVSSP